MEKRRKFLMDNREVFIEIQLLKHLYERICNTSPVNLGDKSCTDANDFPNENVPNYRPPGRPGISFM